MILAVVVPILSLPESYRMRPFNFAYRHAAPFSLPVDQSAYMVLEVKVSTVWMKREVGANDILIQFRRCPRNGKQV